MTKVCSAGFPHSDICGSMDICSSPQLFAAYHVFHRLLVPRHPPCALYSLTCRIVLLFSSGLFCIALLCRPGCSKLLCFSIDVTQWPRMSLVFDDRNVTSFHLPISLFEIFRSLTSSILILEIIFNVQFSRYHITCFASYFEKSLRDSRRFHRNALLSSTD